METSGTQRLRVEAAGNVNFANNVNVSGTSTVTGIAQFSNTINLTHASAGQNYIYFNEDIQLARNGVGTRLKIDSDGRVLIGQTSSVNGVYGSPPPRFSVSTTTASPAIFATYSNDVYGSRIDLIKSRSTTVGGTTVVQANDAIGEIVFGGADGDQFHPTALIQSTVETGVGNNDMPGDLRFFTNLGATTATERMRISSAGYVTAPQQPYAMLGITANQAVTQASTKEVIFDSVMYDTANAYNSSNGRYTCPVVGDYLVTFDCQYTGTVIAFHAGIGVNGTNPPGGTNFDIWNHTGDNVRGDNIARVIRITATTQYISFFTYTNSSGANLEPNRTKATIKFLG